MHPTQAREIVACARGRVLRSVLRPVHVDPHYAPRAQASEVGRRRGHHGWANPREREEPALGSSAPDVARLAACHRFREGEGVARQKRKEIEVSVPARIRQEPGFGCPHVVTQLQKSVGDDRSRISSANAPQKRRSGSSERGPSSGRGSAGDTVGRRIERTDRRESASPVKTGEDRRRPRVSRDRHPAVLSSRKRCGGRGTGAVRATGSYEGPLPMEGIPDHHEATVFTSRRSGWSWRSSAPSDPYQPAQKADVRQGKQRS
jgi:hypothetical protein